jgi:hypothetical protein
MDLKDGLLVWGSIDDIETLNLETGQTTRVPRASNEKYMLPRACASEWVTYLIADEQEGSDIVAYNLNTGEKVFVGRAFVAQEMESSRRYQCDGRYVAWVGGTPTGLLPHVFNLETRMTQVIDLFVYQYLRLDGEILLTDFGGYDLSRQVYFNIRYNATGLLRTEPLLADDRLFWTSSGGGGRPVYVYTAPIVRD